MNIDIVTTSDDNFKIITSKIENQFVDSNKIDVEELPQSITDVNSQPVVDNNKPKPVPLENSKEGHPFDLFGGTSWAGKRQPH